MSAETGNPSEVTEDQPPVGISFNGIKLTTSADPSLNFEGIDGIADKVRDFNLKLNIADDQLDAVKRMVTSSITQRQSQACSWSKTYVSAQPDPSFVAQLMEQCLDNIAVDSSRVLQWCKGCGGYVMTRRLQYFQPSRDPADPLYRITDDVERYLCEAKHSFSAQPEPEPAPRQPAPGH